jgi:glycosyltransferase involved in cell wall biosynthesis
VLQALSFGRCALTSDIEPNVEALGGCGLTFKSGDIADLRRQLQFVLDHPEFVAACAEPARTRARDTYSWDAVVSRLESIYADCLGRPHAAVVPASTS